MLLPREFTTVTTTSKLLAFIMFITFPIIGFFLGTQYQSYQTANTPEYMNPNKPSAELVLSPKMSITAPIIAQVPIIEEISPMSGSIGDTITIRGSGFTMENNDIAFTSPQLDFQGRNTTYTNQVFSQDGQTLSFDLPDTLGACAFSRMEANKVCVMIGLGLPKGTVQISVINKNGESNKISFNVNEKTKTDLEKAEEKIYQSPEYESLIKLLEKNFREGGGYEIGVQNCGETFCLDIDIETKDVSSVRQKIPAQIAGYEVKANIRDLN